MKILHLNIISRDAEPRFLMGYILQQAHPVIANDGDSKIGTIFPDWNIETPGRCLAFYGKKAILNKILQQNYFKEMIDLNILEAVIVEAPMGDFPKVRFIRNQKITGNTPNAIKRKVRRIISRQIQRGEIDNESQYRPRLDQNLGDFPDTFYHILYLDSSSTQQNMPLCIQLESINEGESKLCMERNTFDHYGFSSLSKHRGVVPMVSPFF
ncbi:type I-F CRISPR-associated endoribonuclease Cas6/Csy4 [Endozoicomonas euniceicola]|uniref:Type I-F CRISPR-associated endoribonuclease Cas6/Csy4 n=1 Tax=Endozoicomonas euniceicola TaxID=1234143 RepID=A0ABY6H0J5_9GAMM|nr:type I-F CRISPR-associated endoribonuclease Cas6/Csy4 [Endozoicomonas euniceicola]UYM17674.1 type I-F CRISPR-associated endoribonuclease Cas6/Csy4 [Endozoicomonas euniceicola]